MGSDGATAAAARRRAREVAVGALGGVAGRDADIFLARLDRWWDDLWSALSVPYGAVLAEAAGGGDHGGGGGFADELVRLLVARYRERPGDLALLDLERTLAPDWFQEPDVVGYACYADRFAGTLAGVGERLGYLAELGVRYLHLMPLLAARPGESDGGYAVADYRRVDPRLGTVEDLEALCRRLRRHRIALCADLVVNHCAAEHEWAVRARAGERRCAEMFHVFSDRTLPDAYEATLPEIFPAFAPGNFTYVPELSGWVWTTFHAFQWDLNWSNPAVFLAMADNLAFLANRGVEVVRLDAIAFLWKRLGTDCQNQPEVHDLLQALRACARIVAPAVVLKAEAIVGPRQLTAYLGTGRHHAKEADLAYHNSLMAQAWSALASRDARLATRALSSLPAKPPTAAWATYLRNHDDVGWAVADEDAAAVGLDGAAHRSFLADYHSGAFPGSSARGADFQRNDATGDRRTNGTTASLAGLEAALDASDPVLVDYATRRILLAHALVFAYDGVPLVHMGDELGFTNDWDAARQPDADGRWLHRPAMDWERAARRDEPGTVEHRLFGGLVALARARAATPQLHAATPLDVVDLGDRRLFALRRPHPLGPLLAVFNVTEEEASFRVGAAGEPAPVPALDKLTGALVATAADDEVPLAPYQARWLVPAEP